MSFVVAERIHLLIISFLISSVYAFSILNVGNISNQINENYGPSENLRGWINISLRDENFNLPVSVSYRPGNGVENTGGGGGSGVTDSSTPINFAGNGGAGIVIIAYPS